MQSVYATTTVVGSYTGCTTAFEVYVSLRRASVMNVFLHSTLNASLGMSCQLVFNDLEIACSLLAKQLKPILVLFERVKTSPGLLPSFNIFSMDFSTALSGTWLFTMSHMANAVEYLLHIIGEALLYFWCNDK